MIYPEAKAIAAKLARRRAALPPLTLHSGSAVVFLTVRSTSIEFERATPGRCISTSEWKRSRSSASR